MKIATEIYTERGHVKIGKFKRIAQWHKEELQHVTTDVSVKNRKIEIDDKKGKFF